MTALPYDLSQPIGHRASFGLIALQTDETVEHELRQILPGDGVALHITRVPSAAQVSAESLQQMAAHLPASAALLPPSLNFASVGYACTSGATVIGPAQVAALVQSRCRTNHVTNPLTATIAACRALGASRIGFVSPYVAHVSAALRAALTAEGIEIAAFASFDEAEEARVARIAPRSISDAVAHVAAQATVDAVFVSCTNLRALPVIAETEAALGLSVISSNQALGWHMMRQAGLDHAPVEFGRLFSA